MRQTKNSTQKHKKSTKKSKHNPAPSAKIFICVLRVPCIRGSGRAERYPFLWTQRRPDVTSGRHSPSTPASSTCRRCPPPSACVQMPSDPKLSRIPTISFLCLPRHGGIQLPTSIRKTIRMLTLPEATQRYLNHLSINCNVWL